MDFRGTYKGGGGPDKTILLSAAQHDRDKVHVLVTYLRQPQDSDFQIADNARSLGIHYCDLVDRYLIDWQCLARLKQIVREKHIEVLHSHDDKTLLYSVILRYFVPGLRIMHTCHSHAEYARDTFASWSEYRKFRLRKKIQLLLMKRHLSPVITISDNTRQRLLRGGLRPTQVAVLYNGIDTVRWRRQNGKPVLRRELGLTDREILVGTVARITFDKDLPTFFEVARHVKKRVPGARFVIVGDGYGRELERAREQAARLGLADIVSFTGHRSDLLDIYASLDLFLMTSLTEGLPNTVLEAMAMGVPVVSTDVGGVPELIRNGQDGLLCPVGEADQLADAVCTLLDAPGRRREMAVNARQRVEEKFDFGRRVRILEDIYAYFAGKGNWPHY